MVSLGWGGDIRFQFHAERSTFREKNNRRNKRPGNDFSMTTLTGWNQQLERERFSEVTGSRYEMVRIKIL